MSDRNPRFKRVVVSVAGTLGSHGTIRFAAGLARQLELELFGLYLEDRRLLELAPLSFLREFRPLAGGWRSLDTVRLGEELETARRMAQRAFTEAAVQLRAASHFEVVSGATEQPLAALSPSGDLLVIGISAAPGFETTLATAELVNQAFRSTDAVMLLRQRIVRRAGPVAIIGDTEDDPVFLAASDIAEALGAHTVPVDLVKNAEKVGVDAAAAVLAWGSIREQMIVLPYQHGGAILAQRLAETRGVPVLIFDHERVV